MVYYVLVGTKATRDRPMFLITNQAEAARYGAQAARLPRIWYIGYQTELPDPNRLAFNALLRSHPRRVSWRSTEAAYGDVVVTNPLLATGDKRAGRKE